MQDPDSNTKKRIRGKEENVRNKGKYKIRKTRKRSRRSDCSSGYLVLLREAEGWK
jgi:hypothetical protein